MAFGDDGFNLTNSNREFITVKLPLIVNDDERALQGFGGDINEVFMRDGKLRFSSNSGTFHRNMIQASAASCHQLVLCARKYRHCITGEERLDMEFVGTSRKTYEFKGMYDFSYLPYYNTFAPECTIPVPFATPEQFTRPFTINELEESMRSALASFPSTSFLPYMLPTMFQFHDEPKSLMASKDSFLSTLKSSSDGVNMVMDRAFNTDCIDNSPPPSEVVATTGAVDDALDDAQSDTDGYCADFISKRKSSLHHKLNQENRLFTIDPFVLDIPTKLSSILEAKKERALSAHGELNTVLEDMFLKRPIWLASDLLDYLQTVSGNFRPGNVVPLLRYFAYRLSKGPWMRCWVRYGCNPYLDPECKKYQVVELRIHRVLWDAAINYSACKRPRMHLLEESDFPRGITIKHGFLPSRQRHYVQYCDILMDEVQQRVHSNDGKEVRIDCVFGWTVEGLADFVRKVVINDIQNTINSDIGAASSKIEF